MLDGGMSEAILSRRSLCPLAGVACLTKSLTFAATGNFDERVASGRQLKSPMTMLFDMILILCVMILDAVPCLTMVGLSTNGCLTLRRMKLVALPLEMSRGDWNLMASCPVRASRSMGKNSAIVRLDMLRSLFHLTERLRVARTSFEFALSRKRIRRAGIRDSVSTVRCDLSSDRPTM